ncbi:MAG: DUF2279 domain-containing protein [Caldimonas sp.]
MIWRRRGICWLAALLCAGASAALAQAQEAGNDAPAPEGSVRTPVFEGRGPRTGAYSFLANADNAKVETGLILAGITAVGLKTWNWGSKRSFHTHSEGWFGRDTSSGGSDKLGHAFSSFAISNVLTDAMHFRGGSREDAALTAAVLTLGVMTYVEVFDGYSKDHGFSREDMAMNVSGIGLSYLRSVLPGLRDRIDFRIEYLPSGHKGFRPFSDYAGQRFLLALRPSGFAALRNTPLCFVELHAGYYARGFTEAENRRRERTPYVGIGIDLSELVFGRRRASSELDSLDHIGRLLLEHLQVPGTSYRALEEHRR